MVNFYPISIRWWDRGWDGYGSVRESEEYIENENRGENTLPNEAYLAPKEGTL